MPGIDGNLHARKGQKHDREQVERKHGQATKEHQLNQNRPQLRLSRPEVSSLKEPSLRAAPTGFASLNLAFEGHDVRLLARHYVSENDFGFLAEANRLECSLFENGTSP